MKRFWFDDCKTAELKDERKQSLALSERLWKVLDTKLKLELTAVQKKRRSLKSLLTQNYSEYQADRNATERTLLEIIDLLPLEESP